MKSFSILCASIFTLFVSTPIQAKIIHVPADSSTIQGAVNGAENGDTILIAPGVYNENVDLDCKALVLASHYLIDHDTMAIDSTIIDGGGGNALSWEGCDCFPENGRLTVIGFTIRNSFYGVWKFLEWWFDEPKAKSRICHNRFINNYCGAVNLTYDTCVIDSNLFINNQVGVECYGNVSKYEEKLLPPTCTTIVENNVFLFNSEVGAVAWGGALQIFRNNIFSRNTWGIVGSYYSSLNAVRNVFCNNSVGVYYEVFVPYQDSLIIENNIIASNDTGIYIWGSGENTRIRYNDVWNSPRGNFIGCPAGSGDTTWGTNFNRTPCDSFYNIMRDPLFADTIDFELLCNSPCIDAGDSSIYVPSDSGGCRIDMGAREYLYILGDATSYSTIDIGDVVFIINYLFRNGPEPCPYHSADTNCDGEVNIGDVVCLINYLFRGGDLPCQSGAAG